MKVLFTSGRQLRYTRNQSLFDAFTRFADVTVIGSDHKNYLLRHIVIIWKLLFVDKRQYDVIFVGFYGQLLIIFVKLITHKPIIFDAYISTYQTLCFDRKKLSANSLIGRLAFYIDKKACSSADRILLDTNAHIDYFVATYQLERSLFSRIFVGANEDMFRPHESSQHKTPVVFTYSEYQPLHGMEYVVRAAKLLEQKVRFVLVGKGQERETINELAKSLNLSNVEFIDWVNYEELPRYIAEADICLGGHFGNTEKASMVIAGKTFQFSAMARPTLLAENTANRELFGDQGVYAKPGDPDDLAAQITALLDSPERREEYGRRCYEVYKEKASAAQITTELKMLAGTVIHD